SLPSRTERQITFGPNQHFYGYQGHAGNTPFNHSGSQLALLEVSFQDRLVTASDVANVVLVDVTSAQSRVLTSTRAWNFQQGTMLYWNPLQPDEELVFNDRTTEGSAGQASRAACGHGRYGAVDQPFVAVPDRHRYVRRGPLAGRNLAVHRLVHYGPRWDRRPRDAGAGALRLGVGPESRRMVRY